MTLHTHSEVGCSFYHNPGYLHDYTLSLGAPGLITLGIGQGSATLFCKGPDGKYFRLRGPYGLCCSYFAVVAQKQP